jgi:hypothetical protein
MRRRREGLGGCELGKVTWLGTSATADGERALLACHGCGLWVHSLCVVVAGGGRGGRREGAHVISLKMAAFHAYVALNSGQKHLQHLFVCPKKETTGTRAAAEALAAGKGGQGQGFCVDERVFKKRQTPCTSGPSCNKRKTRPTTRRKRETRCWRTN